MPADAFSSGTEWIVDARGCDESVLRNLLQIGNLCREIITDLRLTVIGEPQWHQFPDPGGVTGLYLLSESHLACHTFPELGLMTMNLYCCRPRREWNWDAALRRHVNAGHIHVVRVARGGLPLPAGTPLSTDRTAKRGDSGDESDRSTSSFMPHQGHRA